MLPKLILASLTALATVPTSLPGSGEAARWTTEIVTSPGLPPARAVETSIPITVVVMDSFGDPRLIGAVRRTVGAERNNLIVIKRSALRPELLVELAHAMKTSVAKHGPNPEKQVSMYFMQERRWRTPTAAEAAWARQVIAQLRTARTRSFGKLGARLAVDSRLP